MNIDWSRVAKPQDDGYDADVLEHLLATKWGWTKGVVDTPITLCGNTVAVRPDPYAYGSAEYMVDHFDAFTSDEAAALDKYLAIWPTGFRSMQRTLDEFYPKWFPDRPFMRGSASGHQPLSNTHTRMSVFVTINDPEGGAAGIYHEWGHLRLEVVGMYIDYHDNTLITNTPEELYDSPVRHDVQRPMSAVIHGLYAWVMLSENDLWCAQHIEAEPAIRHYLAINIPKIENGIREVRNYVRTTPEGEQFINGMLDWADDLVHRSHEFMQNTLTPEEYARLFGR